MRVVEPQTKRRTLAAMTTLVVAFGAGVLAGRVMLAPQPTPGGGPWPQDPTDESVGRGSPASPISAASREAGHETSDVQAGVMARLVALLGGSVIVVVAGMIGFRIWMTAAQQAATPPLTALQTSPVEPPSPHLEADPAAALARAEAAQRRESDSYGWNDTAHARAHIPIAQAMPLLVGRSLDETP